MLKGWEQTQPYKRLLLQEENLLEQYQGDNYEAIRHN